MPAPPRRGRPQRRTIPDAELVHEARQLARRRAQLEAQLADNHRARLASVLELRGLGLSVQDVADLLDVSKGRVQQMAHEGHDAGLEHDARRCPYPDRHA